MSSGGGSEKQAPHLRRNQACERCRQRKVRCDAQRPICTPCRRHAYTLGVSPETMQCTFRRPLGEDDPTDTGDEESHQRIARLEQRIGILEQVIERQGRFIDENLPHLSATFTAAMEQDFGTPSTTSSTRIQDPRYHYGERMTSTPTPVHSNTSLAHGTGNQQSTVTRPTTTAGIQAAGFPASSGDNSSGVSVNDLFRSMGLEPFSPSPGYENEDLGDGYRYDSR